MPGWSFRGSDTDSSVGSEASQVVLTQPAGVQVGDLMVAVILCETESFGSPTVATPAGWTLGKQRDLTVGSNGPVLAMFYKIATAADTPGTNYTFTWAHTATGFSAFLGVWRGVHRTSPLQTPVDFSVRANDTSGTIASNNLAPLNATDLAVIAFGIVDDVPVNFTPPPNTTERTDFTSSGTGPADFLSLEVVEYINLLSGSHQATVDNMNYNAGLGGALVFTRNPSPDAPILGARANYNATQAADFPWTFSDAMPGDVQTAYQLRIYRVSDSVLVVDTGKVASAAALHTVAGGTLTNGNQYQWQVKTWDIDDNESAWATLQSFYTSQPPTATVTAPATDGFDVTAPEYDATWAFQDPEAEAQSAYQVVLRLQSDNSIVSDTGKVLSALNTHRITGLQNGISYRLEVWVWDAKGLKSAAAAVRLFDVVFIPPPTPTILVTDEGHYLKILITNPAPGGGQAITATNDLFRRVQGEAAWVRIAKDIATNVIYHDHAVASGVTYEYKARGKTAVGAIADSAVGIEQVVLSRTWIHDPSDSTASARGIRNRTLKRSSSKEIGVSYLQFEGREHPVAEFGDDEAETVSFDLLLLSGSGDIEALRGLIGRKKTLCYRDPRGRKIFGVVDSLDESDHVLGAEVPVTIMAVDYSEEV